MNKKVCKKEISVYFVLYLIVLKYLMKNRESTFTVYLSWLIIGSAFQEKEALQITGNLEQEYRNDKNLLGNSACCGGVSSLLNRGKYYYNARWYDPGLGRFITEDPIRAGANWFIYANNSPLRFIDPTGLDSADSAYSREESKIEHVKNLEENIQQINNELELVKANHRESKGSTQELEAELSDQILEFQADLPIDIGDISQKDPALNALAEKSGNEGLANPGRYACAYLSNAFLAQQETGEKVTRRDLVNGANLSPKMPKILNENFTVGDHYSMQTIAVSLLGKNASSNYAASAKTATHSLQKFGTVNNNTHFKAADGNGNILYDPDPQIATTKNLDAYYMKWSY